MDFTHDSQRIYRNGEDGQVLAELLFPPAGEKIVNIERTFVDSSLRGQGIANALLLELAQRLRREGKKAILTCPYAKRWFKGKAEWADILVNAADYAE